MFNIPGLVVVNVRYTTYYCADGDLRVCADLVITTLAAIHEVYNAI